MKFREQVIQKAKNIVIKLGSNVVLNNCGDNIYPIVSSIHKLRQESVAVTLVSSGAVGFGATYGNLGFNPKTIAEKQAAAAIGQLILMDKYKNSLTLFDIKHAQILLTHGDLHCHISAKNIKNTLSELMKRYILPIINENDVVSTVELKRGDNDMLSALLAVQIKADLLILLTDVDGLYDKNPKTHKDACLIKTIDKTDYYYAISDEKTLTGTGGMKSKIEAVHYAGLFDIPTVIANGTKSYILEAIFAGEDVGTCYLPSNKFSKTENA